MSESVFIKSEFFMLIFFSIVLPIGIYAYMMWKKAISRATVLLFSIILVAISGIDVFLSHRLIEMAKGTPSLVDDILFTSELSIMHYILPAVFAGIGVNLMSHILISHLSEAERKFDLAHGKTSAEKCVERDLTVDIDQFQ